MRREIGRSIMSFDEATLECQFTFRNKRKWVSKNIHFILISLLFYVVVY